MLSRVLFFIILVCLFCNSLPTQAQLLDWLCQPAIVNYSKHTYGAYNQNWSVVQDGYTGYMYFANSQGLLEFDGSQWKVYPLPGKQIVRSVAADGKGRIYTGGLGEIGYWEHTANGDLVYRSLNKLITNDRFNREEIWKILVDKDCIWFQSFSLVYKYQAGHVETLQVPGNILFLEKVNGQHRVGVLDKGLYELKNNQFSLLKGSEFLSKAEIPVLLSYQANAMLIGTNNEGLFTRDTAGFRFLDSEASRFLKAYQLNKGIQLNDSTYAFGSILNGIILTDRQGYILQHLNQAKGLQDNTVLALTTDKAGNLWVGLDKGIDLIVLSSPIKHYKDVNGELGAIYDAAIFENKLYLGTNHGVFYTSLHTLKKTSFTLVQGTQGQVWDLEVLDGQLLCGHNQGTFVINGQTATRISTVTGGWVIKQLKKRPDVLLQGTYTGLCIYRKNADGHWIFSHILPEFNEPVHDWQEDAAGNIWFSSTSAGVYKIKLSNNADKISEKTHFKVSNGLPNSAVSSVTLLNEQIIVCTDSAVLSFDPLSHRFIKDTLLKRKLGERVHKVLGENKLERLILRKDGGISYLQAGKLWPELYLNRISWVDSYEQVVPIQADTYLACQEDGFALIPKAAFYQKNHPCVSPRIRRVQALNAIASEIKDSENNLPTFLPNQNDLIFSFSTPFYGTQLQHSYWLEGFSKDWSPFGSQFQKEYTNLPAGQYTFHVRNKGCNLTTSYTFVIASRWYDTQWAKALFGIGIIGVILVIVQIYHYRVRVGQERLRRRLEKKLKKQDEYHQQLIVQHRNEKLEQDILNKSADLANSTANLVQKNRILLEIKQQVGMIKADLVDKLLNEHYNKLLRLIDNNLSTQHDEHLFGANFNKVHEEFFKKLLEKHPGLMPSDLKLAAFLRMNLSSKEIAQLLNITSRGVEIKRYRLRKRLNLANDQNLNEFMMKF